MRILVTGHLGFVGAETVGAIEASGRGVVGYDLMELCDIRCHRQLAETVNLLRPERILHLAAIARFADADRDPMLAWQTNVEGTRNVVEVAKAFHIPLVYASTGSAIMPLDGYEPPYREDIPARGNSVYGVTKAFGEYIVRQHTPHIILRYAHIYGKEKRGHGLVGGFVERIQRGLQPRLYGGQQTNDFVYIKDIAQANLLALTAPWDKWNRIYHIGTGIELTASEAGRLVCGVMGYGGKVEVKEPRQVDPGRFCFDISKARAMLGYEPHYSFEDGLRDMFNG